MLRSTVLLACAAALLALALLAEPALAQSGDPAQAGENFADFLRNLLTPVLFTIAAAIAITAIFRRDVPLVLMVICFVIVIGSLLLENTPWAPFTEDVAHEILGSGDSREPRR